MYRNVLDLVYSVSSRYLQKPRTHLSAGTHLFCDIDRDNPLGYEFQILPKLAERVDNLPHLSSTYLDCYRMHLLDEGGSH